MIEDLDGPDPAPSRRVHMRIVSVALAAAALVGYAAASSPALQGPFAEPKPSAAPSLNDVALPSFTTGPLPSGVFILGPSIREASGPSTICWAAAVVSQRVALGGGQTIAVMAPIGSAQPTCPPRPLPASQPVPIDRVSH